MEDLQKIDDLLNALKRVKMELKRRNKISTNLRDRQEFFTQNKIQKLNTDLNWQCMEYDKSKTDFARLYKNSVFDVGVEVKEYRPSGFHFYRH